MKLFFLVLGFYLLSLQSGVSQVGVFTEFDIEASAEVENIEGNIMETRIGVIYSFHPILRLRAGVSKLGRREIRGGYYEKYLNFQNEETFIYESLSLRHNIISSGNSAFIGLEMIPKRFLIGLDIHMVNRNLQKGLVQAFYSFSSTNSETGASISNVREVYGYESSYNSMNFIKANLKVGYSIYKKPRGAVTLYLNYAHDFSENEILQIESAYPELEMLNNSIVGGEIYGGTFNGFLNNSNSYYERNYFSVGLNTSYFFNIDVEKPKGLRIGG